MVISSPCLTDIKNWLVQGKRLCCDEEKTKTKSISLSVYANDAGLAHNEDGVQSVPQNRNVKRRVMTDRASTSAANMHNDLQNMRNDLQNMRREIPESSSMRSQIYGF
ncbi:hypothetical protein Tco_1002977 [Tanacetum coccineum]|uniref:Uncharacterized protein n=1 Tax=Tanacetum coccineum TaxID=301880 RepID=A0ABQ5F8E6_9ASTR